MAKAISQRKLDSWRREWQRKLGLRDWKIKIGFATEDFIREITGFDAVGACEAHAEPKEARIYILENVAELPKDQQDVEETVVHELFHCHFEPFRTEEPMVQLQIEQIIEVITKALLNEKRGKSGKIG